MHWYMLPLQKEEGAEGYVGGEWKRGGKAMRVCQFFGKGTGWGALNWYDML